MYAKKILYSVICVFYYVSISAMETGAEFEKRCNNMISLITKARFIPTQDSRITAYPHTCFLSIKNKIAKITLEKKR